MSIIALKSMTKYLYVSIQYQQKSSAIAQILCIKLLLLFSFVVNVDLDIFVVLARVELKSPRVFVNESFDFSFQGYVRYNYVRVYQLHCSRAVAWLLSVL